MNYQKIYTDLINSAKNNPHEGYTENHHIVPKCLGGEDTNDNLVKLSARQHFIAHWLLYKIHGGSALVYAWNNMCRISEGQEERYQNSKHFARVKTNRAKELSLGMSGSGNHFYGRTHSEESKKMMSEKRKARVTSEETKMKMSKTRKGVAKSEETKLRMKQTAAIRHKNKIMLKNVDTGECIRIEKDLAVNYDPAVWMNTFKYAMLQQTTLIECPHCGTIGKSLSNMKRWHFEKCRKKQNES